MSSSLAEEISARLGSWPFYLQLENWNWPKWAEISMSHNSDFFFFLFFWFVPCIFIRIGTLFTLFLIFLWQKSFFPWNDWFLGCKVKKRKVLSKKKYIIDSFEVPQLGLARLFTIKRHFTALKKHKISWKKIVVSWKTCDELVTSVMALSLHFIYDGHMPNVRKRILTQKNVHDILQLAIYLQIQALQSHCCRYKKNS